MSQFTMICIVIATGLLCFAYIISRPDTKARLDARKEQNKQEYDKYYDYEKKILELENENKILKENIKNNNIIVHKNDNTILWILIIGLIIYILYLHSQLNDFYQFKQMLENMF